MTAYTLATPGKAAEQLSTLFQSLEEYVGWMSISEDVCFAQDERLLIGSVHLKPSLNVGDGDVADNILASIKCGFFYWHTRPYSEVVEEAYAALGLGENDKQATQRRKAEFAVRSIASVATRTGLLMPQFDPDVASSMPFRRPTTLIVDTGAILQGSLDFAARFLWPMARIKVPAIVHMELSNNSDNYFKHRRQPVDKIKKGEALLSHVNSQGGQRVLLRLELQTDTEIERTSIFSDPLRNAFQPDTDTDAKGLNVSAPVRSYSDRLILETARQHRAQSNPGHSTMIMTSDQGLARMSLAEGLPALFSEVPRMSEWSARLLGGTRFHPYNHQLYEVSLVSLLWELAATFGSSRIADKNGTKYFEVASIGEGLRSQPFHWKDNLLWTKLVGFGNGAATSRGANRDGALQPAQLASHSKKTSLSDRSRASAYKGAYKFSLVSMLGLIEALSTRGEIIEREGARIVSVKRINDFRDYKNFLAAGRFISHEDGRLVSTERLADLWNALKARDFGNIGSLLRTVPSFAEFIDFLDTHRPATAGQSPPISERAVPTYRTLAEICAVALQVPKEGIYSTPSNPLPSEFTEAALECYDKLATSDRLVPTGAWLESLAREHGIHPLHARERLEEARAAGLLDRFSEGATPDTRFEDHNFRTLELQAGKLTVRTIYLYHGDFIIPEKASVSIRLERKSP